MEHNATVSFSRGDLSEVVTLDGFYNLLIKTVELSLNFTFMLTFGQSVWDVTKAIELRRRLRQYFEVGVLAHQLM